MYLGSSSGPRTGAAWFDPRAGGLLRMADGDGDVVDELALGRPSYTGTLTEEGATFLFARP